MYTVKEMIQDLQSFDSNLTVEQLFGNTAFIDRLSEIVNSWPTRSKRTVRAILRGPPKRATLTGCHSRPSEEALRAISQIKGIALPSSLTTIYDEWCKHPASFWDSRGFSIKSGNLSHLYKDMKQLETQRQSSTILWRFFTLFFFDLMRLIGDGRKYLVETLQQKVVDAIDTFGLMQDAAGIIQGDLKRWASAGFRYHNIAMRLGDGALLLLPHEVTDNIWENRLPMKGPCFDAAMMHLVGLGIREVSQNIGADHLGSEIRKMILEPFKCLLDKPADPTVSSISIPATTWEKHVIFNEECRSQIFEQPSEAMSSSSTSTSVREEDPRINPGPGCESNPHHQLAVGDTHFQGIFDNAYELVDLASFDLLQPMIDLSDYDIFSADW